MSAPFTFWFLPKFASSAILYVRVISLLHVLVSSCVHGTAEPLDGVAELPDTQTSPQTDVNETYCSADVEAIRLLNPLLLGPRVPAVRQKGVQHLRKVRQGQERQGQHWHHGHDGSGLEVS